MARIKVAWYVPILPERHLRHHGLSLEEVRPIREAWARGDAAAAVAMTTSDIARRLSIAGTPAECLERISGEFAGTGVNHLVAMVADGWHAKLISGQSVDGVPSIKDQLHLINEQIVARL